MLRILHLSDIHYSYDKKSEIESFILPALNKLIEEENKTSMIDLIAITGDLINQGGKNFPPHINPFEEFESNFLNKLNFDKYKIVFAPGNHDIIRTADKSYVEKGLKEELDSVEKTNSYIENSLTNNDFEGFKRVEKFKTFEKIYHKENPIEKNITNFHSNYIFNLDDQKISITAFNSSWRCYDSDNDYGNILLGEKQITESRPFLENSDIKIAIMHHSLDCFSNFENSYLNFIEKDYDLLLTGHFHTGSNTNINTGSGGIIKVAAPGNWTYNIRDKISTIGCVIVDYTQEDLEVKIHHKKYYHSASEFRNDVSLGDKEGIQKFSIMSDTAKDKYLNELNQSKKLIEQTEDVRNSHLLSYNTNSIAPKDLESIFVMPKLIKRRIKTDENIQELEDEKYDIKKIMDEENNFIILGGKETGKTVLLDKIFLDYSINVKKYHRLPVYVDANQVLNYIETNIADFLNISKSKLNDYLSENEIVLLLDNISFENSRKSITKKIEKFLCDNPRIKVISTLDTSIDGSIPISLFENFKIFKEYKIITIDGFKTKEIKELIKKWFNYNDSYINCDEKINSILNFFKTLNIPTTPLSISMFLWLIEKQESYKPINKASMLQDFLNKMFSYTKEGVRTYYTDDFDVNNNERLLAKISYEMLEKGEENYRIEYNELLTIIGAHISLRKFDFKSDDLLNNYLIKGILIQEYSNSKNYIRFRFNCFFEYFLAKQMTFSEDFKNYIINEERYLFFFNVIDYYTGIIRDGDKLLEILVNRMDEKYQDITKKFIESSCGLDTVFERTAKRIACNLSLKEDILPVLEVKEETKPSAQELEAVSDDIIDSISYENKIEKKDKKLSLLLELERSWTIPATVLRNTDEVEKDSLKLEMYTRILKSSIVFCSIYKLMIDDYIKRMDETQKKVEEGILEMQNVLPLLHQILLHTILGTNKLSIIIKEKIENDFDSIENKYSKNSTLKNIKSNKQLSDLEKYMSVFIYCDIKKDKESLKNIKHLIGSIRNKGIYDMILFKLISYYYFRAHTKDDEKEYENLIADVLIKANNRLNNKNKSKIINAYKEAKKGHLEEGEI